jgi:multidrug efflux pump subunit AcrA (membrane-fusion protein)
MILDELTKDDVSRIRPGMTAEVVAKGPLMERAMTIPASAVGLNEAGYAVHLKGRSADQAVRVSIGPMEGGRVVVLEGLKETDSVLENWLDGQR